jgi:hypothetical protein
MFIKINAAAVKLATAFFYGIVHQNEYNPLAAGAWVQAGAKCERLILFRVVSLVFRIACMDFV